MKEKLFRPAYGPYFSYRDHMVPRSVRNSWCLWKPPQELSSREGEGRHQELEQLLSMFSLLDHLYVNVEEVENMSFVQNTSKTTVLRRASCGLHLKMFYPKGRLSSFRHVDAGIRKSKCCLKQFLVLDPFDLLLWYIRNILRHWITIMLRP